MKQQAKDRLGRFGKCEKGACRYAFGAAAQKEEGVMQVQELLDHKGANVETISPGSPVMAAVGRMRVSGVGALVASEDGKTIKGFIDERIIVWNFARHSHALADLHVRDIMRRRVVTCAPTDGLRGVMAKMTENRVRHLPVIEHGTLVGIVSIGDIVKSRLEDLELETRVLHDIALARR
jgi:CBS domain-containing protein